MECLACGRADYVFDMLRRVQAAFVVAKGDKVAASNLGRTQPKLDGN